MTSQSALHYERNSPSSDLCMTTIHGRQYDVSSFVHKHPGGRTAIMLAHGQDATELFESYHSLSTRAHMVLDKYAVEPKSKDEPSVASKQYMNDPFYSTVAARVKKYFEHKGVPVVATRRGLAVYVTVMVSYVFLYVCSFLQGSWLALGPFIFVAWKVAGIGHDGAHFQIARSETVNNLGGMCIGTISGPWRWYWQHTVGHHVNTNKHGSDPDLHHYDPVMRVHDRFMYNDHHKYQAYYAPLVWLTLSLALSLAEPLLSGVTKTNQDGVQRITVNRWSQLPWALMWHEVHIMWFLVAHFVVPSFYMPLSKAIFFGLCYVWGTGVLFGLGSQVNHLSDECIRAGGDDTKSWAQRQVESSADFSRDDPLAFLFFNGLNLQIEHHLFPGVNHEHLPQIAPIVERTCQEFGVAYRCLPTFAAALRGHVAFLRKMGTKSAA